MYSRLIVVLLSAGCHELFALEPIELALDGSTGTVGDGDTSGDADPTARKLVFVTSVFETGALGGLAGADAHCQALATAAGLPGSYMAWLSTSTESPATRMTHATVPYALVGGVIIADNWDDLVDGQLRSAIVFAETGEGPPEPLQVCQGAEVRSNTNADGTWSGVNACSNWTATTGTSPTARYSASGPEWTEANCQSVNCAIELPYYCFQQ